MSIAHPASAPVLVKMEVLPHQTSTDKAGRPKTTAHEGTGVVPEATSTVVQGEPETRDS